MSERAPTAPGGEKLVFGRGKFTLIALISLALHLSLLFLLPFFFRKATPPSPLEAQVIWKEKSDENKNDLKNKQLVSSMVPENEKKPEKAQFLAEKDHSTRTETKAPTVAQLPSPTATSGGSYAESLKAPPQRASAQSETTQEEPSVDDFLAHPKKARSKNEKDPLGLNRDLPRLPVPQTAGSNDHLPGVKEGDHTELNTWQWRHAPFFNRVKAAVGRVWAPNAQIVRYDPRGLLLGQKDRTTIMSVTIDLEGNLKDLKVAGTSGVAYLDEEAERTFRAAAPFPFPPKELFDNQEEFTFNFAFHIEVNRGISFDFDWVSPN